MCFYRQEQFLQDKELAFQRKSGLKALKISEDKPHNETSLMANSKIITRQANDNTLKTDNNMI